MSTVWLNWAKEIQAISQAGIAFTKDPFDRERFERLRELSVEILNEYSDHDMERIHSLFTNEVGYQTPKLDIRGVVFKDGQLLMVKEKLDNKWSLPGGFCDIGLSPSENIIKEVQEESGFEVAAKKLLAVLDYNKHPHPPNAYHYYKIFIKCDIIGGEATKGMETEAVGFFNLESLPELSPSRITVNQIQMLFDFLEHPNKETVFD